MFFDLLKFNEMQQIIQSLKVNTHKTNYIFMSHERSTEHNHYTKAANMYFKTRQSTFINNSAWFMNTAAGHASH
jgi:hypothetical protein